jgi:hypothetical protein
VSYDRSGEIRKRIGISPESNMGMGEEQRFRPRQRNEIM